jgi:hypothetical protein
MNMMAVYVRATANHFGVLLHAGCGNPLCEPGKCLLRTGLLMERHNRNRRRWN